MGRNHVKVSPERKEFVRAVRQANWEHGGCAGAVRFSIKNMERVLRSATTSDEAKQHAGLIVSELYQLQNLLARNVLIEKLEKENGSSSSL